MGVPLRINRFNILAHLLWFFPLFLKRFSCVFGTVWPFLNSNHFKKKNVKNTYQNLPPYPFLSVQS